MGPLNGSLATKRSRTGAVRGISVLSCSKEGQGHTRRNPTQQSVYLASHSSPVTHFGDEKHDFAIPPDTLSSSSLRIFNLRFICIYGEQGPPNSPSLVICRSWGPRIDRPTQLWPKVYSHVGGGNNKRIFSSSHNFDAAAASAASSVVVPCAIDRQQKSSFIILAGVEKS